MTSHARPGHGWAGGVGYRDTKPAGLPEDERPTLVFTASAARAFLKMINGS